MNPAGVTILAVVLLVATGFGVWRLRTDGRLRDQRSTPLASVAPEAAGSTSVTVLAGPAMFTAHDLGAPLGSRATLVQFSTVFCQPCRATRRILDEVADMVDGVRHVDVDAEQHLDLVRRLDIRRTPTIFVLDGSGRVVKRATGQPRKADLVAALGEIL
jgi:thiol-disulfide isomerase/thioredoxin